MSLKKIFVYITTLIPLLVVIGCNASSSSYWKNSPFLGNSSPYKYKESKNNQIIKVKIYQGSPQAIKVHKKRSGQYVFTNLNNSIKKTKGVFVPQESGTYKTHQNKFTFKNKVYRGSLSIIKETNNTFTYINLVPIEDYLMSIVGHEMNPRWNIEVLKIQTILAHTYLQNKIMLNEDKEYDIGSTTADQVYKGIPIETLNLKKAVLQEKDKILTYRGKLAEVYYHASSGGRTASAEEVWGANIPYLKSILVPYSDGDNKKPWTYNIPISKVKSLFDLSSLKKIAITERSPSKRVQYITFTTQNSKVKISANEFRKKIGYTKIRSTYFKISKVDIKTITLVGAGYGHGVGLCQWGAKYMTNKGHSYREVLQHFFPGTHIKKS